MIHLYWDGNREAVALVQGDIRGAESVLCRIHSSCITGHVFLSVECDCRAQLDEAMALMHSQGRGIVVWLDQEGRGNGSLAHVQSQSLKRTGMTQSAAYQSLGYPADARRYVTAANIVRDFGPLSVQLISRNEAKLQALQEAGLTVLSHPG